METSDTAARPRGRKVRVDQGLATAVGMEPSIPRQSGLRLLRGGGPVHSDLCLRPSRIRIRNPRFPVRNPRARSLYLNCSQFGRVGYDHLRGSRVR